MIDWSPGIRPEIKKTLIVVAFLQLFVSGAATFCCDEVGLIVGEVALTVR